MTQPHRPISDVFIRNKEGNLKTNGTSMLHVFYTFFSLVAPFISLDCGH